MRRIGLSDFIELRYRLYKSPKAPKTVQREKNKGLISRKESKAFPSKIPTKIPAAISAIAPKTPDLPIFLTKVLRLRSLCFACSSFFSISFILFSRRISAMSSEHYGSIEYIILHRSRSLQYIQEEDPYYF